MNADPLDAACLGIPTDLFFPRRDNVGDAAAAIRICRRCPIAAACLAWAVDNHETGVWGGTTDRHRERIRRRQRTGTRWNLRRNSDRQARVTALTSAGQTAVEIGYILGVDVRTVVLYRSKARAA